jgi:hypothetical protein
VLIAGCVKASKVLSNSTWHEKCGWEPEDYFDDPQTIALCKAIEADDLSEIDRLVAGGANVNAQGTAKMTPLLWAFPDNKLARFKKLLEYGADPNVVIDSDFNTRGAMRAGDSVTHMSCKTTFHGYFEAVFAHGGDPNLKRTSVIGVNDSPIFSVIKSGGRNKMEKIQLLLDKGADINHMNGAWATPVMQATSWGGQYDIALMLLEAGADYRIYKPKSNSKLVHLVLSQERRSAAWTPQQRADYQKLLGWLEDHGESLQEARADRERWKSWHHFDGEYSSKMDAEIAERKAQEAREEQATDKDDDDAIH